jgi:hypothetical protein
MVRPASAKAVHPETALDRRTRRLQRCGGLGVDPFEKWLDDLAELIRIHRQIQFAIGDHLRHGEKHFLVGVARTYREFAQALEERGVCSITAPTLKNWAWVARAVQPSCRNDALRWSHHAVVANARLTPAEQKLWLARAQAHGWSVRTLRQKVREVATLDGGESDAERRSRSLAADSARQEPAGAEKEGAIPSEAPKGGSTVGPEFELEQAVAATVAINAIPLTGMVAVPAEAFRRLVAIDAVPVDGVVAVPAGPYQQLIAVNPIPLDGTVTITRESLQQLLASGPCAEATQSVATIARIRVESASDDLSEVLNVRGRVAQHRGKGDSKQ